MIPSSTGEGRDAVGCPPRGTHPIFCHLSPSPKFSKKLGGQAKLSHQTTSTNLRFGEDHCRSSSRAHGDGDQPCCVLMPCPGADGKLPISLTHSNSRCHGLVKSELKIFAHRRQALCEGCIPPRSWRAHREAWDLTALSVGQASSPLVQACYTIRMHHEFNVSHKLWHGKL